MEHPWQVLTVLIIQLGFKTIKVFPCISHRFPEIWKDRKRPSSSASKKRHLKQNRLPSLFAFKKLDCWTPQSFPIVCRHWHVLGTSSESTVIWSLWPINIHPMFPRISSPRFSRNKALLSYDVSTFIKVLRWNRGTVVILNAESLWGNIATWAAQK